MQGFLGKSTKKEQPYTLLDPESPYHSLLWNPQGALEPSPFLESLGPYRIPRDSFGIPRDSFGIPWEFLGVPYQSLFEIPCARSTAQSLVDVCWSTATCLGISRSSIRPYAFPFLEFLSFPCLPIPFWNS